MTAGKYPARKGPDKRYQSPLLRFLPGMLPLRQGRWNDVRALDFEREGDGSERGAFATPLEPGDLLSYEVEGEEVRMRKVGRFDAAWHRALSATLEEWNSPEDDEAFRDL